MDGVFIERVERGVAHLCSRKIWPMRLSQSGVLQCIRSGTSMQQKDPANEIEPLSSSCNAS